MAQPRSNVVNSVRVVIDVILLILVALPTIVFKFGKIEPTKRGFFCDDESIRYPYKDGTVSTTALILVGGITNLVAFIVCEKIQYTLGEKSRTVTVYEKVFGFAIHPCLYIICGFTWALGFGILFTQGLTDIGKWSIGRLRPHFISGCNISIDLSTCTVGQYIQEFECHQQSQKILDDLRLSFPSGHASMSAFTMIFLCCYLQQRVPRFPFSYLLKHVLQFIALAMAWFCALSRVMDYKHHPTDVLAGSILGTVIALLCARYVTKGFRNPYRHGPYPQAGRSLDQEHAKDSDTNVDLTSVQQTSYRTTE